RRLSGHLLHWTGARSELDSHRASKHCSEHVGNIPPFYDVLSNNRGGLGRSHGLGDMAPKVRNQALAREHYYPFTSSASEYTDRALRQDYATHRRANYSLRRQQSRYLRV